MAKKHDLPAMPFYVGDWLKAPDVRTLRPDYRGLYFDMLCYMWESPERGVMVMHNGKPFSKESIVKIVGLDCDNSGKWLDEIIEMEIISIREDGAIFSRKMVKDEQIREIRTMAGKKGGRTISHLQEGFKHLYLFEDYTNKRYKIGIAKDPTDRLYKIRYNTNNPNIVITASYEFENAGRLEREIHNHFINELDGEWLSPSKFPDKTIIDYFHSFCRAKLKANTQAKSQANTENETVNENTLLKKGDSKGETKKVLSYPELEEVKEYFESMSFPKEEAESFFNHYSSQGWIKTNGLPVSKTGWKATAQIWHKNQIKRNLEEKEKKNGTKSGAGSYQSRLEYKPDLSDYDKRIKELKAQGFD